MFIDTGANVRSSIRCWPTIWALKNINGDKPAAPFYPVDRLDLAGITLRNHFVAVADFASLRAVAGFSIQGSLGADFLSRAPFCLDFTDSTLTFYSRKTFAPPAAARQYKIRLISTPTSGMPYARANPLCGIPVIGGQIGNFNCDVMLDSASSPDLSFIGPKFCRETPRTRRLGTASIRSSYCGSRKSSAELRLRIKVHDISLFGRTMISPTMSEPKLKTPILSHPVEKWESRAAARPAPGKLSPDLRSYATGQIWVEDRPLAYHFHCCAPAAGLDLNKPNLSHQPPSCWPPIRGRRHRRSKPTPREQSRWIRLYRPAPPSSSPQPTEHPEIVQMIMAADHTNINQQTVKNATPLMMVTGQQSEGITCQTPTQCRC